LFGEIGRNMIWRNNMKKRKTAGAPINPGAVTGFEKLYNPISRDEGLVTIGQWVTDTCLTFGCRPELAWKVATMFIGGLRKELENMN
jgi:hypothetical protein